MRRFGLVLVGVALLVAACTPTGFKPLDPQYAAQRITPDSEYPSEVVGLSVPGPGQVRVEAPTTNRSDNGRAVFWPAGQAKVTDATSCQTWTGPGSPINAVQPGVALRITPTRAITVTKNIWFYAFTHLMVNYWVGSAGNFTQESTAFMDFEPLLHQDAGIAPFPWHICTRAAGSTLTTKVWLDGEAEPGWGPAADPLHVQSVTVPSAAWVYPGNVGGYIGHVFPGYSFLVTDFGVSFP